MLNMKFKTLCNVLFNSQYSFMVLLSFDTYGNMDVVILGFITDK